MAELFKKYKVDYQGRKNCFEGAKDAYHAGKHVVLYYPFIATDTDYSFFVDGERYNAKYTDNGYEISFIMPEHDVTVRVESRNSMMCLQPETGED